MEKSCERCGGTYLAHRPTQRFCSHPCRAQAASDEARRDCSIDECDATAITRGWCEKHYGAWKRTGDPLGWRDNPQRRFWERVSEAPTGCWLWGGRLSGGGYGQFRVDGRQLVVHRFSYELLVGPIPEGFQLDHLCRVRHCVNPAHLEPVTRSENVQRSVPYWARLRPLPSCVDCGKKLARRNALRCKSCEMFRRHRLGIV